MVNLSSAIQATKAFATKHSPEILTGVGIAGMITTIVIAVKVTPKAMDIIAQEEEVVERELKPVEVVKATWKCYIPTAVLCVASTACLVGASSVSIKRNAVLTTAYALSEKTLREYKDAVVETIGEKGEKKVREKIAENHLENDPVSKHDVIITGGGEQLCYDAIGGRYFKSSIDRIRKAENEINRLLMRDENISLNELYHELGLEQTRLGDELGWRFDGTLIDLDFSAKLAENGEPCIVIDYSTPPTYDYYKYS